MKIYVDADACPVVQIVSALQENTISPARCFATQTRFEESFEQMVRKALKL